MRASHIGQPRGQGPLWAMVRTWGVWAGADRLQMSWAGARPDCGQLRRVPELPRGRAGRHHVQARQERSHRTLVMSVPGGTARLPRAGGSPVASPRFRLTGGAYFQAEARGQGTGPGLTKWPSWPQPGAGCEFCGRHGARPGPARTALHSPHCRREPGAQRATRPGPDVPHTAQVHVQVSSRPCVRLPWV